MKLNGKRFYIAFGAAILVLALIFGAIAAEWMGYDLLWAAQDAQDAPTQQVAQLSAEQAEIAALSPSQELLSNLYTAVAPSVVNIQVAIAPSADMTIPGLPEGFPFGDQFGGEGMPSPQPFGQGSGFIYDMDGHIITNHHVVDNAEEITVYFANGMWADAELVATDPQADLAVLRVDPPEGVNWQPLPLAAADTLQTGYYVVAVGSPFGLDETMTLGVVSAMGRSMPTGDGAPGSSRYSLPDVIQTDTAINPGNSGGPLLNLNGEVVGVNYAINTRSGSNSGVGFAIPVSVVQKIVPALITDGRFAYSYLGIAGQTITAPVAEEYGIEQNTLGVYVADVIAGGPSDEAGVEVGDIIVGIGDAEVNQFEDLISYLFTETDPGSTVELRVLRGNDVISLDLTVTERPEPTEPTAQLDGEAEITIAEAINIAKEAVSDAGLMDTIDTANARRDQVDGTEVWVVSLTGEDKAATVMVDAVTGEVVELNVE